MPLETPSLLLDGKTYKIEPLTQAMQRAFETYMQENMFAVLVDSKPYLRDHYNEVLTQFCLDRKNGNLVFGSQAFFGFITAGDACPNEHYLELMHWCFARHNDIAKSQLEILVQKNFTVVMKLFEDFLRNFRVTLNEEIEHPEQKKSLE